MRILIDSHALIWSTVEPERLSRRARQILTDPAHELFFSTASLWELTIKIATGKLRPMGSSIRDVADVLRDRGIQILPIKIGHLERLESLPGHHRDPFDRLLLAQALEEELTVLTSDAMFKRYPAKIVW
jgi:PIN domain nuclease of toxin-antitoxin system